MVCSLQGTGLTVSANRHPKLFYTLRGGGGGNTAVVTSFTARVHPAPRWVSTWTFAATARTAAQFKTLLKHVLTSLAAGEPFLGRRCFSCWAKLLDPSLLLLLVRVFA
jgi:FAD/FMN-containing dehydrogenase